MMRLLVVFFTFFVFVNAKIELSIDTYNKLLQIQKLSQEKKYNAALELIDKTIKKKTKKADLAYLYQSKGYILISLDRYEDAIKSFEKMISLEIMKDEVYLNTIYNLAQLNLVTKSYKKSIYYLNKVISLSKKEAKNIPQSWYELLFSNYYELKEYKKAINTLKILIKKEPKNKSFWIYLSQVYILDGQEKKGLGSYEQAYNLNLLDSKDIDTFISFTLQNKLYYKGAELLEKHLKNNDIDSNEKNLKSLFNAYYNAKEYEKALSVQDKLIAKTNKSIYHLQKARVYNILHKRDKAIEFYKKALGDKNLKEYFQGNLELSYLYYDKGLLKETKECLMIAKRDKKTKDQALKFLKSLDF